MPISAEALSKIINHNSNGLCTQQGDRLVKEYAKDVNPDSYSDEWDNWNYDDTPLNLNQGQKNPILENVRQNPISSQMSVSSMLLQQQQMGGQQQMPQQQLMREQYIPQQSGIDYNIIKAIVKECLKEQFGTLNEGATLKQIGLSEGKIKLVDNKGNIFSAPLEYTGNIKDKKK